MITRISNNLAQQIVNTIKDVCSYDINFINPSGIIIASTNASRIGTFHEDRPESSRYRNLYRGCRV